MDFREWIVVFCAFFTFFLTGFDVEGSFGWAISTLLSSPTDDSTFLLVTFFLVDLMFARLRTLSSLKFAIFMELVRYVSWLTRKSKMTFFDSSSPTFSVSSLKQLDSKFSIAELDGIFDIFTHSACSSSTSMLTDIFAFARFSWVLAASKNTSSCNCSNRNKESFSVSQTYSEIADLLMTKTLARHQSLCVQIFESVSFALISLFKFLA